MTPWAAGHPSIPFDVVLEDTSDTGAGVIADRPCKLGMRHLLMVPRGIRERSIVREYSVVRCEERPEGKYLIGLELIAGSNVGVTSGAIEPTAAEEALPKSTGSQLKLLMLAFALACLLVALFMPL